MLFIADKKFGIRCLLTAWLFFDLAVSQFKCDYRMYGRPKVEDCASVFLSMPDAKFRQTMRLATFRKFVEPQLLEPPFSPVQNDLASTMEQMPKFWRHSTQTSGSMKAATAFRSWY